MRRGTGLRGVFGSVLFEEGGAQRIEQLLDFAAVLQRQFQDRHHRFGHIEAAAAARLSETEQVVGMFVALGAEPAVSPDKGFVNQG